MGICVSRMPREAVASGTLQGIKSHQEPMLPQCFNLEITTPRNTESVAIRVIHL